MTAIKAGAQTIVWGDHANQNKLKTVLKEVAECGYEGVEIGARHINLTLKEFKAELMKNRLQLVGLHVGGDYLNEVAAAEDIAQARQVIDFIEKAKGLFLMVSGGRTNNFTEEADRLNRIGEKCQQKGIKVCYHNHFWEIENDYKGLREISMGIDLDNVGFALDLGWVYRAGADPVKAIELFQDKIFVFHFKDVIGRLPDNYQELSLPEMVSAVEIGQGDLDWNQIMNRVNGHSASWVIYEQDFTEKTARASAAISRQYLKEKFEI